MQKREPEGIVIACDFCGTDWDEIKPMIEGHHGSVLCLECLKQALRDLAPSDGEFTCTLCLRTALPAGTPAWSPTDHNNGANPDARACEDCIHQAARAFDKDPDVDWKRPRTHAPEN
ncbi:MAG: hypothetical protein GC164_00615 [Phycisphaera sp.]|nr:hypothetical protein [Phycisphaera sp.]